MSVIGNMCTPVELVITKIDDWVKRRLISQLIKSILRFLQKFLNYFNRTTILTFFVLPPLGDFPVMFSSDLNDAESVKLAIGSSL